MYLRVEIEGNEELYAFPDQNVVKIGRSPSSDIQLLVDGISRYHLEIHDRGADFIIIDKGSTNGSFIDEEQLEANNEYPFNTFFPVKLGFDVYVYLVDEVSPEELAALAAAEDEGESKAAASSGGSVAATGSDSTGGGSLSVRRSSKRKKLKKEEEKDPDDSLGMKNAVLVLVFLAVVAFLTYDSWAPMIMGPSEEEIAAQQAELERQERLRKQREERRKKAAKPQMTEDQKIAAYAPTAIKLDKCLDLDIKPMCDTFKELKERNYYEGFVRYDKDTLVVVLDPKDSFEFFSKRIPEYEMGSETSRAKNQILVKYRVPKILKDGTKPNINTHRVATIPPMSDAYIGTALISEFAQGNLQDILFKSDFKRFIIVFFEILNKDYHYRKHVVIKKENVRLDKIMRKGNLLYLLKKAYRNGDSRDTAGVMRTIGLTLRN
jgi:hypothetical protein